MEKVFVSKSRIDFDEKRKTHAMEAAAETHRQINSGGPLLTRPAVIREYAEEIIGPSGNASRNFNFLGRLTSNEICVYASAAADGAATKPTETLDR